MIKATTKCIPQLRRILGNNKSLFFGAKGGVVVVSNIYYTLLMIYPNRMKLFLSKTFQ